MEFWEEHPFTRKEEILDGSKLIITLASWNKRINNINTIIHNIFDDNTVTPDLFILNLAKQDFGLESYDEPDLSMLKDQGIIPEDLYETLTSNDKIEIHWYTDPELRSWKKYIYVCQRYKDDIVITIDDDVIYHNLFIESMLKSYDLYNRKFPISVQYDIYNNMFQLNGSAILFKPKWLNYNHQVFTKELLHMVPEDTAILAIFNFNHHPILPVIGHFIYKALSFNEGESNYGNYVFNEKFLNDMNNMANKISEIIYNLSDKTNEEINLYFTTRFTQEYYGKQNLQIILDEFDKPDVNCYIKYVLDSIKEHLSGNVKSFKELADKIGNILLYYQ